jgi:seryl-tRNA synthetase
MRACPNALDEALRIRGYAPCSQEVVRLDEEVRALTLERERCLAEKKKNAVALAKGKQTKQDHTSLEPLIQKGIVLRTRIEQLEARQREKEGRLQSYLDALPNNPAADVPAGHSEQDNVCLKTWGTPPTFSFKPRPHYELGEPLGLSSNLGVRLSGSRFVVLQGTLAHLERSLAALMLNLHTEEFGYTEISPPYLVKEEALYGVGQLPKFSEEAFQTTDGRWLISTAEVSLVNLARERTFEEKDLPQRFVAYTPCFRSEAGAAGRDTRGLIRLHQFSKVELVAFSSPEDETAQHEAMLGHAEAVLQRLQLPYRVMVLCAGDMGFHARKTYDLEVWMPSEGRYREISSCSSCGDFQARRMAARFKGKDGKKGFIHTLNASGLAVSRTIAALLENHQKEDGTIAWPKALAPFMMKADAQKGPVW